MNTPADQGSFTSEGASGSGLGPVEQPDLSTGGATGGTGGVVPVAQPGRGVENVAYASEEAETISRDGTGDLRADLAELINDSRDGADLYRWNFLDAADAVLAAGWRPPLPACDCEPFTACPHIEQADPNEQAAIQLGYCEASVQASSDPEDGEQCPNLREPGYVNCHLHRSSPLPDSDQRGVWQSPDGVHLAVEANDGELEWLECDAVGGWLLRGMLDMVPDEWVRLVPLPDSETEWGYRYEHWTPNSGRATTEADARAHLVDPCVTLLKRRAAGPWIEVTS